MSRFNQAQINDAVSRALNAEPMPSKRLGLLSRIKIKSTGAVAGIAGLASVSMPKFAHAALDMSSYAIDMGPWETTFMTMAGTMGALFVGKRVWEWLRK